MVRLILVLALFTSCRKHIDNMEVFTIKKHYSCHRVNAIDQNNLSGTAILGESCLYDLDYRQINKLVGLCSGIQGVHRNSARIGWLNEDINFILYAYWYTDGDRDWVELDTVGVGEEFTYSVSITSEGFIMSVNGNIKFVENVNSNLPTSYMLYPYFGGKEPNPNNDEIKALLNY